jgi:hypothetical protein
MPVATKFTILGTAVDLTDVSVNPAAAPTTTPRQGGFTLRNRVNFANVSAANKLMWTVTDQTPATETTVPFYVLEVPSRTLVKDLRVFSVQGQTVPGFDLDYVAAPTNSDLDATVLEWGATRNRKPTTHASYAAATDLLALTTVDAEANYADGMLGSAPFGDMKLKVATNELVFADQFQALDSSLANPLEPTAAYKAVRPSAAAASGAATLSQWTDGVYFPYGGYVHMKLGPWNVACSSNIASVADFHDGASDAAKVYLEGVWEIQANCNYVPE